MDVRRLFGAATCALLGIAAGCGSEAAPPAPFGIDERSDAGASGHEGLGDGGSGGGGDGGAVDPGSRNDRLIGGSIMVAGEAVVTGDGKLDSGGGVGILAP